MLDFLISPAFAQQAAQAQSPLPTVLMFIAIPILFYFMLIRPQSKRAREHKDMLGKLVKGDEIVTNGGIAGVVRDIGENFVTVDVADGVNVKFQKSAISSVLPKGTLKAH